MKNHTKQIYRVIFYQEDKRYDLYANHIISSDEMMGFVGIADIVFNEVSGSIIDSAEEKLKSEFGDVRCCYIPCYNIVRIDEVKQSGKPSIVDAERGGHSKVIRPQAFKNSILPSTYD